MTARFADSLFFFALGNPVDPAHKQAKEFAASGSSCHDLAF